MDKINLKAIIITVVIVAAVTVLGVALLNSQSTQKESGKSATALDALVGQPFPNISLYDKDGKTVSVENFKGKNAVLFFSEGVMCYPACWDEIVSLGTNPKLNDTSTAVYSVVTDSPQEWTTARDKMPDLNKATILFDQGSNVSRQLGLLSLSSSMHMGQKPGHTYVVLDKNGIVKYVYDDPNMAKNDDLILSKISAFNN